MARIEGGQREIARLRKVKNHGEIRGFDSFWVIEEEGNKDQRRGRGIGLQGNDRKEKVI